MQERKSLFKTRISATYTAQQQSYKYTTCRHIPEQLVYRHATLPCSKQLLLSHAGEKYVGGVRQHCMIK